ncbi:hypothetical protein DEDE109153_17705 [Deinococcus deserti]|uniref:YbjN domain-containing protein n=1 Tax=Deinococcus deserti (strain DSM 17065 / CIP 109153 / LMG 22923 / VCD115) TaxID=546414 RepID=C1D2W3_DEIDV|nr:hypothetical protein [Deinococcus deserti]ACO47752.1 Hypothetical protein Deide_2p00870 [Deinococcus deserti VCD115]
MSDLELNDTVLLTPHAPTPYAAAALDFLAEEGFRPSLDDDGDVLFKYEGSLYLLVTASNEPTVLTLLLPYFWPLDDAAERERALEAAMYAHRNVRIGRVTVLEENVTASVNAYLPDDSSFRAVLLSSLEGLVCWCWPPSDGHGDEKTWDLRWDSCFPDVLCRAAPAARHPRVFSLGAPE